MSQKIRIKLKSYDHKLVDKSAEKIVKAVKATDAVVSGPIPLPTTRESTREPLHFRKQESPRAVPAVGLQTPDRHLQLIGKNR